MKDKIILNEFYKFINEELPNETKVEKDIIAMILGSIKGTYDEGKFSIARLLNDGFADALVVILADISEQMESEE